MVFELNSYKFGILLDFLFFTCIPRKLRIGMKNIKVYTVVLWICVACGFLLPVLSSSAAARDVIVSSVYAGDGGTNPNADILHAIANRMEVKLVLVPAPFKRRLLMMQGGEIDFMAGLFKNEERKAYIHFVEPAYKLRSDRVFFVPKGKGDTITRYEDLYGLTIGTTIGARHFPRFDTDENIVKDPVPKGDLSLKKLLLGRIDAVIFPEGAGIDLGYKLGISEQIEIARFRFNRQKQVYIGISKNSTIQQELPRFEAIIRKMIVSGEIRQIYGTYYRQRGLPVPTM